MTQLGALDRIYSDFGNLNYHYVSGYFTAYEKETIDVATGAIGPKLSSFKPEIESENAPKNIFGSLLSSTKKKKTRSKPVLIPQDGFSLASLLPAPAQN